MTFEEFPDRIKHLVQATLPRVKVQSEVFPVYETKGDLVSFGIADSGPCTEIDLKAYHATEPCSRTLCRLVDGAYSTC